MIIIIILGQKSFFRYNIFILISFFLSKSHHFTFMISIHYYYTKIQSIYRSKKTKTKTIFSIFSIVYLLKTISEFSFSLFHTFDNKTCFKHSIEKVFELLNKKIKNIHKA